MATETLSAKLQFQGDAAVAGVNKASRSFMGLGKSAHTAQQGVQNLQKGFAGMGIATAAAGGIATSAVKKYADFEGQMAAVKAVLGEEAAPMFGTLEKQAMKLGSTTSFTGKQAAEAMENLARSGMSAEEIMSAIGPTLAAAAADGMDLGTAADIVASNMKAFGMQASDATRIADTLAFVSAKTNTDMVGLQEGLKFVGPVARSMGIELEDTAAALGVLADVGLKGTLAGTGMKNALLKIAKSAKGGKVAVGQFSAKVENTADGSVNLAGTMLNVVEQLQNIKDPLKRANASMELLGMRGMGAAGAFEALGENEGKIKLLFDNMADKARGKAIEMQNTRLGGLHGTMVRMSSAIDGAFNSLGKFLAPLASPIIEKATAFLGDMSATFGLIGEGADKNKDKLQGLNQTAVALALGIKEGISGAKAIFSAFGTVLKGVLYTADMLLGPFSFFAPGGSGVQGIAGFAIKFAALGIAIKGTTKLIGRMASVTKGTFQIMKGVLGGAANILGRTKTFGKLMSKLPGGLGKVAKVAGAAEKITANPVRVVNFDEMGGLGMGTSTAAAPLGQQSAQTVGAFARMRGAVNGLAGRIPKVGNLLTRNLGSVARGSGSLVSRLAGPAGLVAAAGAAGVGLGMLIDRTFKLSDRISDFAVGFNKRAADRRVEAHRKEVGVASAREQVQQLAKFQQRGVTLGGVKEGKRVTVTRELALERLQSQWSSMKVTQEEQKRLLKVLQPELQKLSTAAELQAQGKPLEVTLKVDGQVVGKATAKAGEEKSSRGARSHSSAPRTGNRR